jgi:ABC-type proline/glycine betaine transport system substrate-binding protein
VKRLVCDAKTIGHRISVPVTLDKENNKGEENMKISTTISTLVAAGVMAFGLGTTASAKSVLTAPEADWTGGQVTCKIIQIILEDEMGYKVKRITMPSGPGTREGIRAGDLDFACETWPSYDSTKEKYMTMFGGDGSVDVFGEAGIIGISSYYVPRYMVEGDGAAAPNLKALADLNQYADVFKSLETGDMGRLIGCPTAAWECRDQERLDLNGINFHAVELGSETAHWAEMPAAYKRGEPFVAYAWEPHWIHAALDLVSIELPAHDAAKWPATGWAKDITLNYGDPNLRDTDPKAVALIENSSLSNGQQAGMILAIDVEGRDMDEVVREWMAVNEDVWRAWIPS